MPKHKKILLLKVILIIIVSTFTPFILLILFKVNPLFVLITSVVLTLISILFSYISLKPLELLVQGFEGFSDGNLNRRLDIRSKDEFEDIANSFNFMAAKVATLMQNLEKNQQIVSAEKNRLDSIMSSIVDGIIALDISRRPLLVNKAAEYMLGYSMHDLMGQQLDGFIKLFNGDEEIMLKAVCQPNFNKPAELAGKDGKRLKINITSAPIAEGVQTNMGCILILHDLSKEEELEQMKLDFVSMASHELKTPLTSIVGYLSVFIEENKSKIPQEDLDLLGKSLVAAKQLFTMVTNLLSVNKIEREQLSVNLMPIDYLPLVKKAGEDLQNQAKLKNINLQINLPINPLSKVMADTVRINEVLDNLIANAINYTNTGGSVTVDVSATPTEVTTTVKDTGIGIPKQAISHLFTKFFRVSNIGQQASKGTGLGLYISKSIIEKHKGRIWVESEVGKGSSFIFTLPLISQSTNTLDGNKFAGQMIQQGNLNY